MKLRDVIDSIHDAIKVESKYILDSVKRGIKIEFSKLSKNIYFMKKFET